MKSGSLHSRKSRVLQKFDTFCFVGAEIRGLFEEESQLSQFIFGQSNLESHVVGCLGWLMLLRFHVSK
jgi:hypothetical protein